MAWVEGGVPLKERSCGVWILRMFRASKSGEWDSKSSRVMSIRGLKRAIWSTDMIWYDMIWCVRKCLYLSVCDFELCVCCCWKNGMCILFIWFGSSYNDLLCMPEGKDTKTTLTIVVICVCFHSTFCFVKLSFDITSKMKCKIVNMKYVELHPKFIQSMFEYFFNLKSNMRRKKLYVTLINFCIWFKYLKRRLIETWGVRHELRMTWAGMVMD